MGEVIEVIGDVTLFKRVTPILYPLRPAPLAMNMSIGFWQAPKFEPYNHEPQENRNKGKALPQPGVIGI